MGRLSSVQVCRLRRILSARRYWPSISLDPGLLLDLVDELLELRELELRHRVASAVEAEADAAALAAGSDDTPVRPLLRVVMDPAVRERDSTRRVRTRADWLRPGAEDDDGREP